MMSNLFKNPLLWVIFVTLMVLTAGYVSYTLKSKKLAEYEYRDEVRKAQQEIVEKYKGTEEEIRDRKEKWNKEKSNISKKVEKEVDNAKNSSKGSYTITATDSNDSVLK